MWPPSPIFPIDSYRKRSVPFRVVPKTDELLSSREMNCCRLCDVVLNISHGGGLCCLCSLALVKMRELHLPEHLVIAAQTLPVIEAECVGKEKRYFVFFLLKIASRMLFLFVFFAACNQQQRNSRENFDKSVSGACLVGRYAIPADVIRCQKLSPTPVVFKRNVPRSTQDHVVKPMLPTRRTMTVFHPMGLPNGIFLKPSLAKKIALRVWLQEWSVTEKKSFYVCIPAFLTLNTIICNAICQCTLVQKTWPGQYKIISGVRGRLSKILEYLPTTNMCQ